MYCYKYDPITFEFLETRKANLNPEETKIQGKEIYCLPIYATFKKPPQLIKFKTAVYDKANDAWLTVDDFRGELIVNSSMQIKTVNEIGPLPSGFVLCTKEQAEIIIDDPIYFIIEDGELIENPDYEEIKRQQEAERVAKLSITKYDFYKNVCKPNGLGYQEVMALINSNDEIAAAWNFCERIYRGDELLNTYIKQYLPNVTDEQLDEIFKDLGR